MIRIDINGKKYKVKNEWKEISFSEYLEIKKTFNEKAPDKLKELYDSKEEDLENVEVSDEDRKEFITFYALFISKFTNCKVSEIRRLSLNVKSGVGMIDLYHTLLRFIYLPKPDEIKVKDSFVFKGQLYSIPETYKRPDGVEILMQHETVESIVECFNFNKKFAESPITNPDYLKYLAATIYRPIQKRMFGLSKEISPYDEHEMLERSKTFESLDMDSIWSSYFFFLYSKQSLDKDSRFYTSRQKESQDLLSIRNISTSSVGTFLLTALLRIMSLRQRVLMRLIALRKRISTIF